MIAYKLLDCQNGSFIVQEYSPYYIKYKVGNIVYAVPDSIGIFCFDSMKNLLKFSSDSRNNCVMEVESMSLCIRPEYICRSTFTENLYKYTPKFLQTVLKKDISLQGGIFRRPPIGTVCFSKIKCLRFIKRR